MRRTYNVHEAKTHLSKILEEVEAGEEVVISRAGTPVVQLVLTTDGFTPRSPGGWQGKVVIHETFDDLDDDIAAAFHGEQR